MSRFRVAGPDDPSTCAIEPGVPVEEREVHVLPAEMYTFRAPDLSAFQGSVSGMAGHLLFIFNLTREMRAQHVVEIGFGEANSALAFLLALRETGGTLTSVDLERRPQAEERISELGLSEQWRFIEAPSETAAAEVRRLTPIDILMIDGLHSYKQCRLDYFRYAPWVRSGGYVLFHDSRTIMGVRDFTQQLLERGLGGVQLDYCNGLFVFQKCDDVIW
ncbi:MAG: class I SAM-dependent methyltransferase [Acidobacteriota bacterium]|nr:MAG: class I SAM-dependent methyltransferase [Acidobacteriota bacterium]